MTTVYILDVEEFRPVIDHAIAREGVAVRQVGPYQELTSPAELVIDRRACGVRHAVWYSAVAGVRSGRVTQYDKDALRVEPE